MATYNETGSSSEQGLLLLTESDPSIIQHQTQSMMQCDSWVNDSYEPVRYSESNHSEVWFLSEWLIWAGSFSADVPKLFAMTGQIYNLIEDVGQK